MRKLASIAVTAGLLVTLSACSAAPGVFAGCAPTGNAALVSADAAFGKDPQAAFPTPLVSTDPELAVLEPGDGDRIDDGAAVDLLISIYDGETGDALQSQSGPLTAVSVRTFVDGRFPFAAALQCANVGARVVTTGTQTELFGPDGLGLPDDPTIVIVTDVEASYLGRANGVDQLPQAGFPSIVLAPDGRPGFTFSSKTPPTELMIATLKAGNGAVVEEGDSVVVNYAGILWGEKSTFDSSWDGGAPATLVAADFTTTDDQSGVVPGFAKALIGQKVGSQVLVVIPPEFGYPAGSAPASIGEDATLVFVIDVLGIQ